jgi:hypothetical protein
VITISRVENCEDNSRRIIGCCVILPSTGKACFVASEVVAFKLIRGHYRASQCYTVCLANIFMVSTKWPCHSPWLPTAEVRIRDLICSCVICGGRSGTGADFLGVLRFPLLIFIPAVAPQSSSFIILVWYNRPVLAAVPSGLTLTTLRIRLRSELHSEIYYREIIGFRVIHVSCTILAQIE